MDFHIQDVGEGRPVLFLHAGVADSRMWRGQMGLDGYRTIAFDRRGFGQTPYHPGTFSDTDDSIAVLDEIGVDSAIVVGCSMGGETALDIAIQLPHRVDALVLIGAIPNGWDPEGGWQPFQWAAEMAAASEAGDLDRMVEVEFLRWVVGRGRDEIDIPAEIRNLFLDMDQIALSTEGERDKHQTGLDTNLDEQLDAIRCPALAMVGAHDEPVFIEAAHYLAARLGNRPAVVIPNSAHLPPLEQPDLFNRELLAFLAQI